VDEDTRVDVEAAHLPGPRTLLAPAVLVAILLDVAASDAQERPAEERQLHAGFERRELRRLARPLLDGALVDEVPLSQPPRHPLLDTLRHGGDLLA